MAAARTVEVLGKVVAEIAATGGRASALPLDLSDPASIENGVRRALADEGQIDVLVNNAGITDDNLVLRMSRESWDRVLSTNLTGAFLLTQAVVKSMVRKRYGRIVNITSVVGLMGNAGQANYAASKAGLIGLTKSVARELASRNVTCNAVAPGYIATAMTEKMTEDAREALTGQIPQAGPEIGNRKSEAESPKSKRAALFDSRFPIPDSRMAGPCPGPSSREE